MNKETIVYCPTCGGEGRVMEAKLYGGGHHEVWEDCYHCDGEGTNTYEYYKAYNYNDSELIAVEPEIIENFPIY